MRERVNKLARNGVICFGVGAAALIVSFFSGFGPCGPNTPLGEALISLGSLLAIAGALLMVGAILKAAFGRW